MKNSHSLFILFFLGITLFFSFCKKKKNKVPENVKIVQSLKDTTYSCIQDSVNTKTLSRVRYSKAIKYCKLTIYDRDFILGQYGLMGARKILGNYFSDKEFNQKSIVIKEVLWETKDGEHFIRVWYQEKNNHWVPLEAYKYHKAVKF
ncbi:hypothetical protein OAT18_00025 [Tenacibaculum sp.]|nr:hypothetical protein [Tenacibaculum sp.]